MPEEPLLPFPELPVARPRRRARSLPERRVTEASLTAYDKIVRSRCRLYKPILRLLQGRGPNPEDCLTAREILRALITLGVLPAHAERNNVSPRLTELLEAGCVESVPDFLKAGRGEPSASVWRLTSKGIDLLNT
jgi:hypothetical protein